MKRQAIVSALSFLCLASAAQAAATDFYWDNSRGFISAANCEISTAKSVPFAISQSSDPSPTAYENLREYGGGIRHYLPNRSVVRFSQARKKTNYKYVDVIGVPSTPGVQTNKWFANRMDEGYLYEKSIQNLEKFVIELKSGISAERIPGTGIQTVGAFLHLAVENGKAMSFVCDLEGEAVEHVVFNVHTADKSQPVARVGVQLDDTAIFKSILTHTVDEADKILDSRMKNAPANHNQTLITTTTPGVAPVLDSAVQSTEVISGSPVSSQGTATRPSLTVTGTTNSSKEVSVTAKLAIPFPSPLSQRPPAPATNSPAATSAVSSSLEYLVCVSGSLAVRNESLDKVLFRAEANETVLPMQSWDGNDKKTTTIDGKQYTFIKVQFPERNEKANIGWLAQEYVRLEGQCPQAKQAAQTSSLSGAIKSIDSANCCTFPTIKRPTHNYSSGMRRFKAGRSGGRLHAANDLYRVHGEETRSLADGKVTLGLYKFYQGTYALEVKYPGGFIARYGELTSKVASGVKTGANVRRGQKLGHIGTVNSGCCLPMLHFELYKGTKTGNLSNGTKPFNRRSDLMDPTPYVRRWEKANFGTSY